MNKNQLKNLLEILLKGIGLISFGIAIFCFVTWLTPNEKPYQQPKEIKLPTTQDVGKFTGKQSKNFIKGFIDGVFSK